MDQSELPVDAATLDALRSLTTSDAKLATLMKATALGVDQPIALASFLDGDHERCLAAHGLPELARMERSGSFCDATVRTGGCLEVEDALADPRFRHNPLVTGPAHVRSCTGYPLFTPDGVEIGALCVMSPRPGRLTDREKEFLALQAVAVTMALDAHLDRRALETSQSRLAEQNWRLESTIAGTNAGTWEWNVQTGETRFNETWARFIGYRLEDLRPISINTWLENTHPEDLQRSGELLNAHFAGDSEFYECEARMRHRDGSWIWVLDRGRVRTWTDQGEPEWMYGTHELITERKHRADALEQSEARLKRVSEVAGIGGWELDCRTGEMTWSDMNYVIHGLPIGQLPAVDEAIEFYAPEAREVIQNALTACIETGAPYDLELPFIRADGSRIWVRAVGQADRADGETLRVTGSFQDITESYELRLELSQERQRLLEHAQALEQQQRELKISNTSLENFAYIASHDLSSPLQNMKSFSELLIRDLGPNLDSRREQYVKFLLQSMDRMQSRIEGLLSLSRVRQATLDLQRVNLAELIERVLGDLSHRIEALDATLDYGELPDAICDATLMEQVIQNLIENSLRYRGEHPPLIRIRGSLDGGSVSLAFADNGIGFKPQHGDRIFRMFERLSTDSEGSGIGLAISRLILERHNGTIDCTAEPGNGATFTLSWPAKPSH